MRRWLLVALGIFIPTLAAAQGAPRPIVGELFTSEGCSSCPPADAKIAELARTRPDLLLLTFHVTYWNYLGWHDPFSLDVATAYQQRYVSLGISPEVYTPALIVDGKLDAIGSDGDAVNAALGRAAATRETAAQIYLHRNGSAINVTLSSGSGQGVVLLIGYDRLHRTHIGIGENGGRLLTEANIVRSMSVIGDWVGQPLHLTDPIPLGSNPFLHARRTSIPKAKERRDEDQNKDPFHYSRSRFVLDHGHGLRQRCDRAGVPTACF
jgi:hypothetical protein